MTRIVLSGPAAYPDPAGDPGCGPDPGSTNTDAMTNPPERPYRRLTLSVTDKKFAGVCGGLAEYFGVDATLVRLIAVVLTLLGGSGLLIYGIAWIIMPKP